MVKEKILKALQKATGEKNIILGVPEILDHGDYATNVALKAKGVAPRENAQKIVEKLEKDKELLDFVDKIEVAGPGFINFWLSTNALTQNLALVGKEKDKYGSSSVGKGKTVVVEYSSPNIAKRFSIGHFRSTVIGQALYNLYAFTGHKTIGDNHLGDWGTQFGVLIYMVERGKLDSAKLKIEDWEELYVDFHTELEKNEALKDEARDAFKRLEEGEPNARKIWKDALDTSLREYEALYKRLDVKIDHAFGESYYEQRMPSIVKRAHDKGVAKRSEGALIIELPKMPPGILLKTNGTTTYFTRDLATVDFRIEKWNPDLIIYEVGADQILHFKQVFEAAEKLGLNKNAKLKHVAHGFFRFKEGKMSTRKGKTIKLEDVLTEAVEKAVKLGSASKELSEEVGIGAIKWNDLKRAPESEIIFDWGEILNMEGNSGPYLQYAYARTQSILSKAKVKNIKDIMGHKNITCSKTEQELLRKLIHFPEVIQDAAKNYSPNILATYLFELAQKFNTFYSSASILKPEGETPKEQESKRYFRLLLTSGVGQVLKNGINLLGIKTPSKM